MTSGWLFPCMSCQESQVLADFQRVVWTILNHVFSPWQRPRWWSVVGSVQRTAGTAVSVGNSSAVTAHKDRFSHQLSEPLQAELIKKSRRSVSCLNKDQEETESVCLTSQRTVLKHLVHSSLLHDSRWAIGCFYQLAKRKWMKIEMCLILNQSNYFNVHININA